MQEKAKSIATAPNKKGKEEEKKKKQKKKVKTEQEVPSTTGTAAAAPNKKGKDEKSGNGKHASNKASKQMLVAHQELSVWRNDVRLYMTDFHKTHAEFNGLRTRQDKEAIIIANHRPACPLMLLRARGQTNNFTLAALVVGAEKYHRDDILKIPNLEQLTGMSLQLVKQKLAMLNKDTLTVFRVAVQSFDRPFVRQPETTIGRAIGKAALKTGDFNRLCNAFAPVLSTYDVPSVVRFWRRQY